MEFELAAYEFDDMEKPSSEFTRFARKVELLKMKEEKPDVKPEKVFEGFKKPKRTSQRIKKKKKETENNKKVVS
jgi:hypothetical protein|tara:strand:+ start:682 stop:903 length:222 start_codon:yes stop_codon:yes gene_type:complete